ncbi:hypothetical protein AB3X96_38670 [Paraburkholderia sp. BR13439]
MIGISMAVLCAGKIIFRENAAGRIIAWISAFVAQNRAVETNKTKYVLRDGYQRRCHRNPTVTRNVGLE